MVGTRGEDKAPGEYRQKQVLVGSEGDTPISARFVPPPPIHVPELMDNLSEFMAAPDPWPPLVGTAIAHYQFETIHPFQDGNGRMGRLLIPLLLMSHGIIERPLVYLSDYLDAHRVEYFAGLKAVSCEAAWEPWIGFFLEAVRQTTVDGARRIKRIVELHERYRTLVREESRSQAPLAAVDLVMSDVTVTVADVMRFAHCTYPTAKAALETLTELGIVSVESRAYPARWWARELIDEAYER